MPEPAPVRRVAKDIPTTAPIVIIGGGIVGVATAWFLKRQGLDSIILETEGDIGTRTTAMSAHCIRAQFSEPDNIRMMAESLAFYEQFARHCGRESPQSPIALCQQGYLFASTDAADKPAFAARVEQQQRAGLDDVELLTGVDVRQRYPWLSEEIEIATYRARDGWIDSRLAVEAMASSAQTPIYLNVRVEEITVSGNRVTGVATSGGTISTDTVILAAGPFSRNLSPDPLPIVLWRRHRVIVRPRSGIPQNGPVTIDANTGAHWRPHLGGALAAWAQPESDAPAVWPVETDPAFVDLILRSDTGICRLAPFWRNRANDLGPSDILLTAGQYTITPDHRPLIGEAPETTGLFLHTGYSGHGIMGAPAGARLLADIMAGVPEVINTFSPSRFDGSTAPPVVERVVI